MVFNQEKFNSQAILTHDRQRSSLNLSIEKIEVKRQEKKKKEIQEEIIEKQKDSFVKIMAKKNAEIMRRKSKSFGMGPRDSIKSSIGGSIKSKITSKQQEKSRMNETISHKFEKSVSQNEGTSTQKDM